MPCDSIIIVYSPNQNLRRRVIVPDSESQVSCFVSSLLPGEEHLIVYQEDYDTYGPDALVGWATMGIPTSDQCMVIRNGVLLHANVSADHLIDTYPDAQIVPVIYARTQGRASGVAI